jgi:hypothetical protein
MRRVGGPQVRQRAHLITGVKMGKAQNLRFADLILDETCLFASRNGQTSQFTRNERALLLAFLRNPRRLMQQPSARRDRFISIRSDRNIDFLVNRLQAHRTAGREYSHAGRHRPRRLGKGDEVRLAGLILSQATKFLYAWLEAWPVPRRAASLAQA